MKRIIIPLCLAWALVGCTTLGPLLGGKSVAAQVGVVSVKTEQALTIADLAYTGLGSQLIANTANGLLKGANAATAKAWYDKAGDALIVAHRADDAANDNGVLSAVSDASDAITKAKALIGS